MTMQLKKPYYQISETEKFYQELYGEITDFQRQRYNKAFENQLSRRSNVTCC